MLSVAFTMADQTVKNKRVLVTGGAGFIGSNFANALAGRNEVIVVDDGYLGTPEHLDSAVEFHERSVLESNLPTDVDVVCHLAALSSYGMHESNPQRGSKVNVEGFVNVVEQARRDGCEAVVYASTSSIYGDRTSPTPEDVDVTVNTAYEASKLAREAYAEYVSNHYGLPLAGLRFFSVYQGYGGAEDHKGEFANVIAQFADDVANGRSPELYGDGSQSRDFVHVDDVVRAIELTAANSLDGVFNVGTGERYSFNTVVDRINRTLGTDVEATYVENPIPDNVYVSHTCADTTKIERATGWRPRIELSEGIERVCSAYKPVASR